MAESAAERIIIDDYVLTAQKRALEQSSATLSGGVGSAQASLGGASFGLMNSFLVSPINQMASRTGELVAEAAEMSKRMAAGVSAAGAAFAECEAAAISALANVNLEGEL